MNWTDEMNVELVKFFTRLIVKISEEDETMLPEVDVHNYMM